MTVKLYTHSQIIKKYTSIRFFNVLLNISSSYRYAKCCYTCKTTSEFQFYNIESKRSDLGLNYILGYMIRLQGEICIDVVDYSLVLF